MDTEDEEEANGKMAMTMDDSSGDDCIDRCEEECGSEAWRIACCSRVGRICIMTIFVIFMYLLLSALQFSEPAKLGGEPEVRQGINLTRAQEVLESLCDAYDQGKVSGDSCNRLCFSRKWTITDYYEGNKIAVIIKDGGQNAVYKSSKPFFSQFPQPDFSMSNDDFSNKVVDLINDELRLGWPKHYRRHLMETLWPTLLRTKGEEMSRADRHSLYSLISQPEFILFRVLPLTRVTPKIIGTCGHLYQTESLVAFRMKGYYTNLKAKILVHLMGTLKLLYEFLDEPLQWCDVRFDNLGLSADYPKRFVLMDGDMVYTRSKLNSLLEGRPCQNDEDCRIGDCTSRCTANLTCSQRSNGNLEVFCEKLVNKLFNNNWSKNNKYLTACRDTGRNITQRLNELRLAWSWNLSDV
ncbi:unnamed protein product [Caenorhabditis angaria]|uniref:FAM69 protein-kinase domain-containing protein n=1 Tax=Caenorhabditis angaria TaxID=860376 RepID=A0A9P1MXL0_9PELO|nr:unnamed protein product [Caenorhabditis angaria]